MLRKIRTLTHDHIDGSRALIRIIRSLYGLRGETFPFGSVDEWVAYFKDAHVNIVEKFDTVTRVLQCREALQLAAETYVAHRSAEGYDYVEAKFGPTFHTRGGLSVLEASQIMCEALWAAGARHGVRVVPHLCINRADSPAVGMEVARAALHFGGLVKLDLACDEGNHPPEKHLPAYALTFGTSTRRECHAAEWTMLEPRETYRERLHRNLHTAVHLLRCHGIGHATTLAEDDELVAEVRDRGIVISGCPLSNLVCGAIGDVRQLGIAKLLDAGVIYTLNADDDLFLPPMEEVTAVCHAAYQFTPVQAEWLDQCQDLARL